MDILVSAIVGDLMNRSASFVINKYFQQQQQQPGIDKILQRLQRVVLRIDTIVEEAEGRRITNQGMLRQLNMLRQGMYRGHYMLDALRIRAPGDDEEVSHSSFALYRFSPAKRLCFSGTGDSSVNSNREALQLLGAINDIRQELQMMVNTLEDTMDGMKEFLFFLNSYPRMTRQPYGAYLFLDNCMFGRQTERQRVLDFLLRPPGAGPDLTVLPIVGPTRVGKSTLVEHVCRDESVRDRFSMILFFSEDSLKDEGVINLGTTEALRLDDLPPEAYWHFFKSLAFGSTNPDEHPKLAAMAMEITLEQRQCFVSARTIAESLQSNFNAQFWRTVLQCVRAYKQKNLLLFEKHPSLLLRQNKPVYYFRLARSCRYFLVICSHHQLDSTEKVPNISVKDIVLGSGDTLPCGEFEALAWKSRLPPYYTYTNRCIMQAPQPTVGRKKRVHQDERHLI